MARLSCSGDRRATGDRRYLPVGVVVVTVVSPPPPALPVLPEPVLVVVVVVLVLVWSPITLYLLSFRDKIVR